jgi:hypothetical protein
MSTAKTRPALPITRAFTNDGRIPNDTLLLVLYRETRRTNRIFSIPIRCRGPNPIWYLGRAGR